MAASSSPQAHPLMLKRARRASLAEAGVDVTDQLGARTALSLNSAHLTAADVQQTIPPLAHPSKWRCWPCPAAWRRKDRRGRSPKSATNPSPRLTNGACLGCNSTRGRGPRQGVEPTPVVEEEPFIAAAVGPRAHSLAQASRQFLPSVLPGLRYANN